MSKGIEKEMVTEKKTEDKINQEEENRQKNEDPVQDSEEQPQEEENEELTESDKESKKSKKKSGNKELTKLKAANAELKDKYLRLYSEFENYRRRTAKEKIELIGTANEELMVELLPVIDDFERAIKVREENNEKGESVDEGVQLIYNKLKNVTEKKGLKIMKTEPGDEFNPEIHDAISQVPAPEDKLKGKIVDTIEKGYYLNEKVIRFAKVVIGS